MSDADRTDVFRGLAHPLRRKVIQRLSMGEVAVAELLDLLHVSPQALSQHLAILRETGLVVARLHRPHQFYRLNPGVIQRARRWINGFPAASSK